MNVSITPELEHLINVRVESGQYASASEVVREALRLIEQRDQVQELLAEDIRGKVAAGFASLRAGEVDDGEAVFARIDAELDAAEHQELA